MSWFLEDEKRRDADAVNLQEWLARTAEDLGKFKEQEDYRQRFFERLKGPPLDGGF